MVTVHQEPATNTPAFNDQWFVASSNQTASANFVFYVTITVYYYDTVTATYTTKAYVETPDNPTDGYLRFNARSYAEKYVKHYIPINTSGINKCLNGCIKIVVNIGERYGTTPTVYSGTNKTYYVWNASLNYLNIPGYSASDYVANNGAAFPILNDYPETGLSVYSQGYLYIYCASDNVLQKARITSTDGSTIYQFDISNSLLASGNWYDRYLAINVSPWYLSVLGGANWGATVGTQYSVQLYDNTGTVRKTVTFDYEEMCDRYYPYQLIYVNKKGAFDHFYFDLLSEKEIEISRTKVKHNEYASTLGGNTQSYTIYTPQSQTYSVEWTESIKLNTDNVTEEQAETLAELFTAPVVYIQDISGSGAGGAYTSIYPVNTTETKYKKTKYFNQKVFQVAALVEFAHNNYRQKGV